MTSKAIVPLKNKLINSSAERRIAAFKKICSQQEAKIFKLEAENFKLKEKIKLLEKDNKARPHLNEMIEAVEKLRDQSA